ncbi:ATP-dependent RNA helicase DDX3X [Fasciola hepatica]|uniref:ATP-dependent RNA helicase DDX3X n=1 Tax=Fasciola hepatica TaxID=6192 RepID=A0A4E0QX84_FASHE|nr:ATP-dependent RNA helicase DDX3X [Fasciola hepatica]
MAQVRELSHGCNILVATPGRLVDMISRGKVSLERVRLNFPAASIHGDRPQPDREQAWSSFRGGHSQISIATAVAARALDIPKVKRVTNFDLPSDIEECLHQISRTGSIGQPGSAVSFFSECNKNVVLDIVKLMCESKQPILTWLKTRLTYSSGDTRSSKDDSAENERRTNYESFRYPQPGDRGSSYLRSSRLMYRGSPGFIGLGGLFAGVGQQAPPGEGTTGPAGGAMSAVSTGGYSAHLPPGAGTPFPGAIYQAFHRASLSPATNSVSAPHTVSSHGGDATTTMGFSPPTGSFYAGGLGALSGTTPNFTSTYSAAGHQASQQQQQQQQAATATSISGSFAMPYYSQPQAHGSTAPRRQSPQQQVATAAAIVVAAATSSGAQAAVPGPDPNNPLSSPVINVTAMQNDNSFSVDSGTAPSTAVAAASAKAGTVIQQIYRGNRVGGW